MTNALIIDRSPEGAHLTPSRPGELVYSTETNKLYIAIFATAGRFDTLIWKEVDAGTTTESAAWVLEPDGAFTTQRLDPGEQRTKAAWTPRLLRGVSFEDGDIVVGLAGYYELAASLTLEAENLVMMRLQARLTTDGTVTSTESPVVRPLIKTGPHAGNPDLLQRTFSLSLLDFLTAGTRIGFFFEFGGIDASRSVKVVVPGTALHGRLL